jgi:HSP20 family molecular chaperone IbpA
VILAAGSRNENGKKFGHLSGDWRWRVRTYEDLMSLGPSVCAPRRHNFGPVCDARAARISPREPLNEPVSWPELEMIKGEGSLVVRLTLRGMAKEDLSVFVDDGGLVVEGYRKHEIADGRATQQALGPRLAKFRRPIPLTDGVSPEHVMARFTDSVLELTFPFPATPAARLPRKERIVIDDASGVLPAEGIDGGSVTAAVEAVPTTRRSRLQPAAIGRYRRLGWY